MKYNKLLFYLLAGAVFASLLIACDKKSQHGDPPVADFFYKTDEDSVYLVSTSIGEILNYKWEVINNHQIILSHPTSEVAAFKRPSETIDVSFKLTVSNDGGTNSCTNDYTIFKPNPYEKWGLGQNLVEEHSNNVSYEWYFDQCSSGQYSYENCGPASATMAIKWADSTFTGTVADARNTILSSGGWWTVNSIISYLDKYRIPNITGDLSNDFKTELNKGNIVILCIDIFYVRDQTGNPEWRIDKYYTSNSIKSGHFIVIKGYKVVSGITWLEAYDPYSCGMQYTDGSLKGRNRYYRSTDILSAAARWWAGMIIVSRAMK